MTTEWQAELTARMQALSFVISRMDQAHGRYGNIASSHEALGVITEEYYELIEAVRSNSLTNIANEALDVAAACVRLAMACELGTIKDRSGK